MILLFAGFMLLPGWRLGFGMYVKLESSNASSIALHGGSFTKVCENADGSLLKKGSLKIE